MPPLFEPAQHKLTARAFAERVSWLLERFAATRDAEEERTPRDWEAQLTAWFDGRIDDIAMHDRGYWGPAGNERGQRSSDDG